MHRSGSSLVASLIQHAGAMIGDRLRPADGGNPRGYFEDLEYLHFHQDILRRQGLTALVSDSAALLPPSPRDARRARALLERRRGHDLWGFKDPRASLFLHFWHKLLEDDVYVFLYRRPIDVVLSLLRRGSDVAVLADPIIALQAWKVYNRGILEFVDRHPKRCVLCDVYGVVEDFAAFVSTLERRLDLPLDFAGAADLLAPEELRRVAESPAIANLMRWIDPRATALHDELQLKADLRGRQPSPAGDSAALRSLAAVAGAVGEDGELWQAMRGPLFALLLSWLSPATAGQSRRTRLLGRLSRAESFRLGDRLERLQRQFDHRTRRSGELESELRRASRRLAELQTEFDQRTRWALELDTRAEERQATSYELQAELDECRRQLIELENRNAAQELRLLDLVARLPLREARSVDTEQG